MINLKFSIFSILVLTTLTACGGGGGESGSDSRKASCGSANSSYFDVSPTQNLCSVGNASSVTKVDTKFNWSCTVDQYNKEDCSANENKAPVLTVSDKKINSDGSYTIPFSVTDFEKDTYSVTITDLNTTDAEVVVDLANSQVIVKPNLDALNNKDFTISFKLVITQTTNGRDIKPVEQTVTLDVKQKAECGISNNGYFSTTPTENLCSQGTPSVVSQTNDKSKYTWNCIVTTENKSDCSALFNEKPVLIIDTEKTSVNEEEVLEINYTLSDKEGDTILVLLESSIPEGKNVSVVLDIDENNKKVVIRPEKTSNNYNISYKLTAKQEGKGNYEVVATHTVLIKNDKNSVPEISLLTSDARLEKQKVDADGNIVKGNDLTDSIVFENGKFVISSQNEEEGIPNTQYSDVIIPLSLFDNDGDALSVSIIPQSGTGTTANYVKDYVLNGVKLPHSIVISGLNRQYIASSEFSFLIKVSDNSEGNQQEATQLVNYVIKKVEALPVLKVTPLTKTEYNNYEDIKLNLSYSDKNNDIDTINAVVEISPNVGSDTVNYPSKFLSNDFTINNMNFDFVNNPSDRNFRIKFTLSDKTGKTDEEIVELKVKEDKDKSIEVLNKKVEESITAFATIKSLDHEIKLLNFYIDYLDLVSQLPNEKKTYQDYIANLKTANINSIQSLITQINTERSKVITTDSEKQLLINYLVSKEKELNEKVYTFGLDQVEYINTIASIDSSKLPLINTELLIEKTKTGGYSRYVGKNDYGYYQDPIDQNIWIFNNSYSVFDIVNNISAVCR